MQTSHSSVSASAQAQSLPHLHSRPSLRPMYAAEFRASLEQASGRKVEWGYWSDGETKHGSFDCLILKEDSQPLFRKSDFVIAEAKTVKDCLRCQETFPDPETLLQLFVDADNLFGRVSQQEVRFGFFIAGGQPVSRQEIDKALRASGLTEVEVPTQAKDQHPIWCFEKTDGKWTLRSWSVSSFLPEQPAIQLQVAKNTNQNPGEPQDHEKFYEAVRQGNSQKVRSLLNAGQDVSVRDQRFNSALHIAAAANQVECLRILLDAGASWKAMNYKCRTPLHVAAANASAESLACLLDFGAAPDVLMDRGISPLHMASWFGHVDMVHMLIQAGASINLLNEDGNSCLHLAAGNGQVKIVKTLIGFGADPDLTNHLGLTYLEVINEGYSGPAIPVI